MFPTVATVSKIEYDAVTDSFWIKAEVVLTQAISRLELDPGQLAATTHADILKDKEVGRYVIAINGPGKPEVEVGHQFKASAHSKADSA